MNVFLIAAGLVLLLDNIHGELAPGTSKKVSGGSFSLGSVTEKTKSPVRGKQGGGGLGGVHFVGGHLGSHENGGFVGGHGNSRFVGSHRNGGLVGSHENGGFISVRGNGGFQPFHGNGGFVSDHGNSRFVGSHRNGGLVGSHENGGFVSVRGNGGFQPFHGNGGFVGGHGNGRFVGSHRNGGLGDRLEGIAHFGSTEIGHGGPIRHVVGHGIGGPKGGGKGGSIFLDANIGEGKGRPIGHGSGGPISHGGVFSLSGSNGGGRPTSHGGPVVVLRDGAISQSGPFSHTSGGHTGVGGGGVVRGVSGGFNLGHGGPFKVDHPGGVLVELTGPVGGGHSGFGSVGESHVSVTKGHGRPTVGISGDGGPVGSFAGGHAVTTGHRGPAGFVFGGGPTGTIGGGHVNTVTRTKEHRGPTVGIPRGVGPLGAVGVGDRGGLAITQGHRGPASFGSADKKPTGGQGVFRVHSGPVGGGQADAGDFFGGGRDVPGIRYIGPSFDVGGEHRRPGRVVTVDREHIGPIKSFSGRGHSVGVGGGGFGTPRVTADAGTHFSTHIGHGGAGDNVVVAGGRGGHIAAHRGEHRNALAVNSVSGGGGHSVAHGDGIDVSGAPLGRSIQHNDPTGDVFGGSQTDGFDIILGQGRYIGSIEPGADTLNQALMMQVFHGSDAELGHISSDEVDIGSLGVQKDRPHSNPKDSVSLSIGGRSSGEKGHGRGSGHGDSLEATSLVSGLGRDYILPAGGHDGGGATSTINVSFGEAPGSGFISRVGSGAADHVVASGKSKKDFSRH
ncbi:glycine-rich cell wall structural protein 1.8-like [Homarus americanus]|uniref:glycine-rich cell wall structural protein 1.8-like n=1 Tax=Homarus americanus TaxID=6706 RepID=UPI001C461A65|nr:glycine-rich cell wall structural protein 1.8-like [Homarus americanus]